MLLENIMRPIFGDSKGGSESSISTAKLFAVVLAIRLVNALTIKTFFQADEYWQSLEPAHYLVYGYGYLTWEWREGLRSFVHPLIFSIAYKICHIFDLDYLYIINLPKVLQAVITSIGEAHLHNLAYKYTSNRLIAQLTVLLSLFSAFNWFCITRSFSNTLELTLTIIGLFYFPINTSEFTTANYSKAVVIGVASCIIRPSNVIIWIFQGINLLLQLNNNMDRLKTIIITVLLSILTTMTNSVIDYLFYLNWNFPLLKFLEFNVVKSLSSFYGVSRIDFYFFQAIPILMLTYLPLMVIGLYYTFKYKNKMENSKILAQLMIMTLIYLIMFSLITHKEFRFIYPLKPVFLIFASYGFTFIDQRISTSSMKLVISSILIANFFLGYYFTQIHESGVVEVVSMLREKVLSEKDQTNAVSIGFMTPCHSTPFQSHFHLTPEQADIWFLTCEPPLHLESSNELYSYRDESDEFYDDPLQFVKENFPSLSTTFNGIDDERTGKYLHDWPDYLVIFEHIQPFFDELLKDSQYEIDGRLFNSRFHWDHRRTGDIIIYKYIK